MEEMMKARRSHKGYTFATNAIAVCAAACGVAGCAAEAATSTDQELAAQEPTGQVSQDLTIVCPGFNTNVYDDCHELTDWSGTVIIRIYQCKQSPIQPHHLEIEGSMVNCAVESDFALVGGGAETQQTGTGNGGLLTGSFPDDIDKMTWHAESKDHVAAQIHWLRAYAIGMRLPGVSGFSLRNAISITQTSSGPAQHPVKNTFAGSNLLIGGGARVRWGVGAPGQLLWYNAPDSALNGGNNNWRGASKDHGVVDGSGFMTTWQISIPANAFGIPLQRGQFNFTQGPPGTGYQFTNFSAPGFNIPAPGNNGFVLTSVGANGVEGPNGRLLTDMFPQHFGAEGTAFGRTKDHLVLQSGNTQVWWVGLRRTP